MPHEGFLFLLCRRRPAGSSRRAGIRVAVFWGPPGVRKYTTSNAILQLWTNSLLLSPLNHAETLHMFQCHESQLNAFRFVATVLLVVQHIPIWRSARSNISNANICRQSLQVACALDRFYIGMDFHRDACPQFCRWIDCCVGPLGF